MKDFNFIAYVLSWIAFVVLAVFGISSFEKTVIAGIFGLHFAIIYYAEKK